MIIGAKLAPDLLRQLDRCCLTDAEVHFGREAWLRFDDPFPAWDVVADAAE